MLLFAKPVLTHECGAAFNKGTMRVVADDGVGNGFVQLVDAENETKIRDGGMPTVQCEQLALAVIGFSISTSA